MNPKSDVTPTIETPQPGGVEDNIMEGTPNQIEIDKDFSEKVTNAVEESPEGDGKVEGKPEDVAASESNNDKYEPAKEFTEFLNKEVAADDHRSQSNTPPEGAKPPAQNADLSVLKELLADNPHMAPAIKEALASKGINLDASSDPATVQRLDGMQDTINNLVNAINGDREASHSQQAFESVNDVYLDVVKDIPEHQRTLTDFFNNALLRDYDLTNINREILEGSNKAITSELDNYYQARLKAEGYSKPTGVPPSANTNLGELTPPPSQKGEKDYGDPNNRPKSAFDEVDRDFSRKVNNLFQQ